MTGNITIGSHGIGGNHPVFIIAEAGVNHNGDLNLACRLVEAAVRAGADAVKFQTFIAENVITKDAPKAQYQEQTTDKNESQLEMVKRLELSFDDFRRIKAYCDEQHITFLSTPFDRESVDFLDELGVPAFKISSGDLTNSDLIDYVARKGRPIILSTGMSNMAEVEAAAVVVRSTGNDQTILLHCVTNYPADPADVNLRAMRTMKDALGYPVGYSDHTLGIEISLAAAALGACVIEKHLTLDRTLPGPDHRASLEPDELKAMVEGIRKIESALGHGAKKPAASEAANAVVARRSLFARTDIRAGMVLTPECVAIKRPGDGLPPAMLSRVVGRTLKIDVPSGAALTWEMFEGGNEPLADSITKSKDSSLALK
jgi:N-acetylneuraminate synthase/N,N'-diacetyllegionaminate synthase